MKSFFASPLGKKFVGLAFLGVIGGAFWVAQSEKPPEVAKKVCAVCVAQGDRTPKTVEARVEFNGEFYDVHSEDHRQLFIRQPPFYAQTLHQLGLHGH